MISSSSSCNTQNVLYNIGMCFHHGPRTPNPTAYLHRCWAWQANLVPLKNMPHLQVGRAPCHGPWLSEQSLGWISGCTCSLSWASSRNEQLAEMWGFWGRIWLGIHPKILPFGFIHLDLEWLRGKYLTSSDLSYFSFIISKSVNEKQVCLKSSAKLRGYVARVFHSEQIFKVKSQNYSLPFLG